MALFRGKKELLERILSNGILKKLISSLNLSEVKSHDAMLATFEIGYLITGVKNEASSVLGETIAMDLGLGDDVSEKFSSIDMLKDGTKFTSSKNKIKFETLLETQDPQIAHLATNYSTADKKFTTGFSKTFGPK